MPIPNAPSDLAVTAQTTTTIDLSWTDNSSDEDNFILQMGSDPDIDNNLLDQQFPAADATTAQFTGLTPGTTYYFQISASNVDGFSAFDGPVTGATDSPAVIPNPADWVPLPPQIPQRPLMFPM